MKIAVLGAGAWGTAISIGLAARHDLTLWARNPQLAADLAQTRTNQTYLPGAALPPVVRVTASLQEALGRTELILIATPTAGMRPTLQQIAAARAEAPVIWLCKGFESESAHLPHQIAESELQDVARTAVLSGPSFAIEIARGLPAALTLAGADVKLVSSLARELHSKTLRVYTSEDVIGVEIAGAIKNVMAIAAGISDGLGLGHNARAALITRGLAEIARLGLRMGGRVETFMGLAGAGDLILTCTGDLSRNRNVGIRLAHGTPIDEVIANLGHVAEGVYTARAVDSIARQLGIEMPITRAVCRVMDEGIAPRIAVQDIMLRDPKSEY